MKPKKKTILQQYEALTPEEITILSTLMEKTLEVSVIKLQEWGNYISSFDNYDTTVLFPPDYLSNQMKELESYKLKVSQLQVILNKIKPLKELVNNE